MDTNLDLREDLREVVNGYDSESDSEGAEDKTARLKKVSATPHRIFCTVESVRAQTRRACFIFSKKCE